MTNEQINIAIAKACGWKWERLWTGEFHGKPIGEQGPFRELPYYCSDLNAMHEAEMMLKSEDCHTYGCYCSNLYEDFGNTVSLTARQRAEAFLKTIGKWEGGPR